MSQSAANKTYFSSTRIAVIAMFSALAAVLYLCNLALSFAFPEFLKLNFSDIPVLIGTFALGPLSGVIIVVMKVVINLALTGTHTAFVGELADLLIGIALVIPAGLIYKKHRTFKGALVAMAAGTAVSVVMAVLVNWLLLVPFYVQVYFNGNWEGLVNTLKPLFPNVTRETFYNYYLWLSIVPFNILRCLVAVLITLPVYKHISRVINRFNTLLAPAEDDGGRARRINVGASIAAAAAVAVLVLFALLQYYVF